jgi:kanamycin kinase
MVSGWPTGGRISVATLSLGWNYPVRWRDQALEQVFFTAYGVDPDPQRIDYYRRLWHASDNACAGPSG